MPRRHIAVIAAAMALPSVAAPARADIQRMYEAGAWSLYTGTSTSGRAVCDMRVADDAGSKRIDVIYFINESHLTVRMNKATWQIPADTRVGVVLQFDNYPVWTATADGAGGDVEFSVPTNALAEFAREFRAGNRMRISFPDGSEAPWLASLAGTSFMLDRFLECVRRIQGTETQPYAQTPATPTQPFSGGGRPAPESPPTFGGAPTPYRGTQPAPEPNPSPAPAPAARDDNRI